MLKNLVQQMLYPVPSQLLPATPPRAWDEVQLSQAATSTVAWVRETQPQSGAPVVIWFHGNGESLETLHLAGLLGCLEDLGCPCLAVEYPGYGGTPGPPSEGALAEAAEAALLCAHDRWPTGRIVLCGWSLGAAVALPLAARYPELTTGLAILSAWTCLDEVARLHFPSWLVRAMLRERYDSLARAPAVRVPALVAHGAADPAIPAQHGARLAAALGGPVRHLEIADAGHNDLLGHGEVWRALDRLLAELAPL